MKFNLEKANYNFDQVNFISDNILGEHIKEPFPNTSFFLAIIGRPGSGKTSMLINLLKQKGDNRIYRKVFDKIILVMPKSSIDNIKNNPFKNLEQIFDSFDSDVYKKVHENYNEYKKDYDKAIEDKKPKPIFNQLLILDDITSELKIKQVEMMLKDLSMNRRHIHLSIIILVQYLRSIPKAIRFQISDVVYFQPSNQLDAQVLNDEFLGMKKNKFDELKDIVWKDKHDYMIINKNNNAIFSKLQKINFED